MKKIVLFLLITFMITDICYSQTAEDNYNSAVAKFKSGDAQGAIADYSAALLINPNYTAAYNDRGLVKLGLNDNQGALADFDKAVHIGSSSI